MYRIWYKSNRDTGVLDTWNDRFTPNWIFTLNEITGYNFDRLTGSGVSHIDQIGMLILMHTFCFIFQIKYKIQVKVQQEPQKRLLLYFNILRYIFTNRRNSQVSFYSIGQE